MRLRFKMEGWGRFVIFQLLDVGEIVDGPVVWIDEKTDLTINRCGELLINKYGIAGINRSNLGELAVLDCGDHNEAYQFERRLWNSLKDWTDTVDWKGEGRWFQPRAGESAF